MTGLTSGVNSATEIYGPSEFNTGRDVFTAHGMFGSVTSLVRSRGPTLIIKASSVIDDVCTNCSPGGNLGDCVADSTGDTCPDLGTFLGCTDTPSVLMGEVLFSARRSGFEVTGETVRIVGNDGGIARGSCGNFARCVLGATCGRASTIMGGCACSMRGGRAMMGGRISRASRTLEVVNCNYAPSFAFSIGSMAGPARRRMST